MKGPIICEVTKAFTVGSFFRESGHIFYSKTLIRRGTKPQTSFHFFYPDRGYPVEGNYTRDEVAERIRGSTGVEPVNGKLTGQSE